MYKAFSRKEGKPGDRRKHQGLTYVKSINGKWLIERDAAFKKLLTRLHVTEGKTLRTISTELGIPHSSVQKALNDLGIMRSKKERAEKRNTFVDKNFKTLKRMYADGMSVQHMCEYINERCETKFDEMSLARALTDKGVTLRTYKEASVARQIVGRQHIPKRGCAVFSAPAIQAWNYHLDLNLDSLTFEQYRRIVARFTGMAVKRFPQFFPGNARTEDRRFSGIDMDHQLSRFSGWYEQKGDTYQKRKKVVPLDVICHPVNLKLIPARANMQKSNRDHHTLEELQEKIAKFSKKHGDIFADYYEQYCVDDLIRLHSERQSGC